jgi:VanZ family protein
MSKTNNNLSSFLLAWLPVVLWAGMIYYLSAQQILPSLVLVTWDFVFKKSAHVFVYGVFYILVFRALQQTTQLSGHQVWLLPLIITLAYATFDELHQSAVSGRTGSLRDVGFDALGCSLVMMRKFGYI